MDVIYSDHAVKRMKQRGITSEEVKFVLNYPEYIKKSFEGRKEAVGTIKNRSIKVAFIEEEKHIKVITII